MSDISGGNAGIRKIRSSGRVFLPEQGISASLKLRRRIFYQQGRARKSGGQHAITKCRKDRVFKIRSAGERERASLRVSVLPNVSLPGIWRARTAEPFPDSRRKLNSLRFKHVARISELSEFKDTGSFFTSENARQNTGAAGNQRKADLTRFKQNSRSK